MGILRRAFERGKALPKKLERALKIQAGLALPDGQITDIDAYHRPARGVWCADGHLKYADADFRDAGK